MVAAKRDDIKQSSAAQRMLEFKQQMRVESSGIGEFYDELPFDPDTFQRDALASVALGNSVLVCAPTGAGKTVVGEGAVYLALSGGERAFYTTPIKALSNQKYREFCDRFGSDEVGMLTGDTSINPHASVVVMTTEVLRNMIYAEADLGALRVVVLDEIHYLADRVRGPVWEEVLIQLPEHIQVVALSATVSNADEFGRWIAEVRGSCDVVVSTRRPVPLYQHMIVGSRLYELFSPTTTLASEDDLTPPRINPDVLRAVRDLENREGPHRARHSGRPRPVSRPRVLQILERENLLPAIVFIFSRAGCEEAAQRVVAAGVTLTGAQEREQIRQEAERVLLSIPIADHGILGLREWQRGLERGIAAHHAGLLPVLKEAVERLFAAGLVKLVYATETLALGINMPARTVVLESLEKWNGSEHVRLTPGEYTQLTGRAGRRGIDIEGNAVVLGRGVVQPEEVAQLASRHSYPLRSAFYPGYNMVVNLLNRSTLEASRQVLESSFAQFQADDSVVELAGRLRKAENILTGLSHDVTCSRGNATEYFQLREDLSLAQKKLSQLARSGNQEAAARAFHHLRPGQAIRYRRGRRWHSAVVVVGAARGWDMPAVKVIGSDGKTYTVASGEVTVGPEVLGQVRLPAHGARRPRDRQSVARQLRALENSAPRSNAGASAKQSPEARHLAQQAEELEHKVRAHPVHSCPDRDLHAAVGHRWVRARRDVTRLSEQINARTSSIAHEFDRVCQVLERLGYIRDNQVTERGEQLRQIFGERDLLIAQVVYEGTLAPLASREIAAVAAALVYEPRGDVATAPIDLPTPGIQTAWSQIQQSYRQIHREESRASLERISAPAPDLMGITYRWASGATLSSVLAESDLTGGDFVRWMRQTIDLLEQLRRTPNEDLRVQVTAAVKALRRGVVAWAD